MYGDARTILFFSPHSVRQSAVRRPQVLDKVETRPIISFVRITHAAERIVRPCTILSPPFALRVKGAYLKPLPASLPVIKYSHPTRTGQEHRLRAVFYFYRKRSLL